MTTRRCSGSTRFGIEPHQAPVDEFPAQPSRKDGLGTMCRPHWSAYVKALREARNGHREPVTVKPRVANADVAAALSLISEVDALSGPECARRVGDPDVQAALELVASVRHIDTQQQEVEE